MPTYSRNIIGSAELASTTRSSRTVPATGVLYLPPRNNMPAGAIEITPSNLALDVERAGATTEPYDPVPVIGVLQKTVYYRLRTVSAGSLTLSYAQPGVRVAIALYLRTAVNPPVFTPVTSHVAAFAGWDAMLSAVPLLALSEYLLQFGELA